MQSNALTCDAELPPASISDSRLRRALYDPVTPPPRSRPATPPCSSTGTFTDGCRSPSALWYSSNNATAASLLSLVWNTASPGLRNDSNGVSIPPPSAATLRPRTPSGTHGVETARPPTLLLRSAPSRLLLLPAAAVDLAP